MAATYTDEYVQLPELASDPATPASGNARLYVKDDNTINVRLDSGTIIDLTSGSNIALNDLSDITITTPSNGDALIYNGASWENGVPSVTVTQLTDTAVSSPQNNQILVYNAGNWSNRDNMIIDSTDFTESAFLSIANVVVTSDAEGGFASLPNSPTIYYHNTTNPVFIPSSNDPSTSGRIAIDLSLSTTSQASRATTIGDFEETLNTGITAIRTPSFDTDIMGMISGYFVIDYATYLEVDATLRLWLIDDTLGNNEVTTSTLDSQLLYDGAVAYQAPTQGDPIIHFNAPIWGAEYGGSGRQYYFVVQNGSTNTFAISEWSIMVNFHEIANDTL